MLPRSNSRKLRNEYIDVLPLAWQCSGSGVLWLAWIIRNLDKKGGYRDL